MIDGGRPITEVARELNVHENLLGKWVRAERLRDGVADDVRKVPPDQDLSASERSELTRLRAELAEKDRDIAFLKKSIGVLCGAASSVSRFELIAAECACHHVMKGGAPLIISRTGFLRVQVGNAASS